MKKEQMEMTIREQQLKIDKLIDENEDLKGEIEYLKEKIDELENPQDEDEDRYEDIKLGLI